MKKVLILLLFIAMLCGCTKIEKNTTIDSLFEVFSNKTSLVNTYSNGYKYYLPNGVRVIDSKDYNEKLYSNGYYYYLYVDVVSYYYKTNDDYEENSSLFYSKKLNYKGNKGYAEIKKKDDLYNIIIYYNYSKIETYVNYDDIKSTIINICSILNSIKFNESVTEQVLGITDTNLSIENFDFYTPRKEGNFIDYINKYDEYEDTKENSIGNEGNE